VTILHIRELQLILPKNLRERKIIAYTETKFKNGYFQQIPNGALS
jgi:hypothetical protein